MKRIGKAFCIVTLLTAGLLTACSAGDDDSYDAQDQYAEYNDINAGIYDGEWTVNKQVVDTARLVVTDVLTVRLPEQYLGISCFEKEYASSAWPIVSIEYNGQPSVIRFKDQGYTDKATFNSLLTTGSNYDGAMLLTHASFVIAVDGVDHRVDVLSDEPGNAVYRNDNGQWTIGFTVTAFHVTNMETLEEQMRTPHKPIALYYSTKKRIR